MVLAACLLAVIFYLVFRLFTLHKSMKRARRELQEISEQLFENRVVKLAVPDRELERLLETVNDNLKAIRSGYRAYQKSERNLKEQIENISHDLRTPLTAILGYLKMIDQEKMSEEDREFLEIAIRKSYTLQELTAQFYELSRVTSNDFQLKLEVLDAARILKETCLESYGLLENAGLEVTMPAFEDPAMICGNADALTRVFSNLIQNSIRYARSELHVEIMQKPEEGSVTVSFWNDICQDQEIPDPERLFERFYMQEESRTQHGTGLGLTISKTLIEHMGGNITASYSNRKENRFLIFTIQLKGAFHPEKEVL